MNKTLNINLAGLIFHIDEEAFKQLERYLETLKRQFQQTDGGSEIVSDIETRIAELFRERTTDGKEVINLTDVLQVIEIMGQPEDYLDPEEEPAQQTASHTFSGSKRLLRDKDSRVIGGVASGVAAYFNIDTIWIRLLFVLLFFTGPGFLVYLIMWIIIPGAKTTAEKLMMRGEPVNISNIQRSIKEEFTDVRGNFQHGKSRSGIAGFINELGRFLFDAFRLIFKFIFKVIGIFLLAIGFVMLFSIVGSLIIGTVDINGTDVGLQYGLEFMKLVTENDSHYNMLLVSIILSVAAPVFLLIYFGIRILFNLDPLNRPTKSGLALITFIGLVLLAVSAVRVAHKFQDGGNVTYDLSLPQHQEYFLTMSDDSISMLFEEDYNFNLHWMPLGKENAFNIVDIDIKSTDEALPYVTVRRESQGVSRAQARKNAEALRYEVILEDSVIKIPSYYLLAEEQKFRAQEIDVVLYLPAGHSVYFDHAIQDYIYDVDNIQDMWDDDMIGKLWIMTEDGLSCDGCEIIEEEEEELRDSLLDWEDGVILEDEMLEGTQEAEDQETQEEAENKESGDLALVDHHTSLNAPHDHGNMFYESIAKPIEEKVRSTTLNILRSNAQLRI